MLDIAIKEIMNKYPITVKKNTTIAKVAELLLNYRINGLIVLEEDNETLFGIVTTTDLLNLLLKGYKMSGDPEDNFRNLAQNPVSEISTQNVLTLDVDSTMKDAIDIIDSKGAHTIPVYNNGKLIGVIGRHDFLNHMFKGKVV